MVGVQVLRGLRVDMALGQAGPSSGAASPGGSCRPPLCADRGRALGFLPSPPRPPAPKPPSPLRSPVSCTLPRQAFFLGSRPVHPLPTGQAPLGVPPPRAPLQTHIQRDSWVPRRPLTPPGGHYLPLLPTSPLFHSDFPALDPWVLAERAVPGDPPENPVLANPLHLGLNCTQVRGALHIRLHVQRSPDRPPLRSRSPCWATEPPDTPWPAGQLLGPEAAVCGWFGVLGVARPSPGLSRRRKPGTAAGVELAAA